MTRPPFEVARLGELERFRQEPDVIPIRIPLGIEAFGVNAYVGREAGSHVVEDHDELGVGAGRHEELYVVLAGRARFVVAGEEVEAEPGTLVFVRDPAVRREAVALEPETTVLAVGGGAGQAFEPSPWESWLGALPFYTRGDYDRAAEVLEAALARHPDNSNVLYNLACCEALGGRREDALAHLARAAERDPRVAGWATSDSDLDSLRGDPAFPA